MDWKDETQTLHTTPTLQVVVNPQLRRGSPIHDAAFANLKGWARSMCGMFRGIPIRGSP